MSKVMNIKIVLSFILLLSVSIYAQTENPDIAPCNKTWLGVGAAYGDCDSGEGFVGFGVSLNHISTGRIYKARYLFLEEIVIDVFGDAPPAGNVWDAGILYGFGSIKNRSAVSFSAGISYVGGRKVRELIENDGYSSYEHEKTNISSVGFPVEVQFAWFFTSDVGASITMFGDLNSENNFGGITLSIIFGELK